MLSKQEKELQRPTSADVSATRHTTTVGKSQRMISEIIVACVFVSSLNSVFECIFQLWTICCFYLSSQKLWVVSCCGSQLLAYTYYVVYMLSIGAFFSHCDMYTTLTWRALWGAIWMFALPLSLSSPPLSQPTPSTNLYVDTFLSLLGESFKATSKCVSLYAEH